MWRGRAWDLGIYTSRSILAVSGCQARIIFILRALSGDLSLAASVPFSAKLAGQLPALVILTLNCFLGISMSNPLYFWDVNQS